MNKTITSPDPEEFQKLMEEVKSLRAQLREAKLKVQALEVNVFRQRSDPEMSNSDVIFDRFQSIKHFLQNSKTMNKNDFNALDHIENKLYELQDINVPQEEYAEQGGEFDPFSPPKRTSLNSLSEKRKGANFGFDSVVNVSNFSRNKQSIITKHAADDDASKLAQSSDLSMSINTGINDHHRPLRESSIGGNPFSPTRNSFAEHKGSFLTSQLLQMSQNQLDLPFHLELEDIEVTECREMSDEQILYVKKVLVVALAEQSKIHRVASTIISAMRALINGNWLCNIRNRDELNGLRFHGRKQGIFLGFSNGQHNFRLQLNKL